MFTGLVQQIGKIKNIQRNTEGLLIEIEAKHLIGEIKIDDSIAVNGCCQTAVKVNKDSFVVQSVGVTLDKTTLGTLRSNDEVNLELALRMGDRLGGHIVQGHVNGTATLESVKNTGDNYLLMLSTENDNFKYMTNEGSICIDGVSLTLAMVNKIRKIFQVTVIPHTYHNTILKNKKVGSQLNLEVDCLAKYVESILTHKSENKINESFLKEQGFMNE